jgi:hypothetical protein
MSTDRNRAASPLGVRVLGDTVVEVTTPEGARHSIRDIGIGHSLHTVGPKGGRVATDAECALFHALVAHHANASTAEPSPNPNEAA